MRRVPPPAAFPSHRRGSLDAMARLLPVSAPALLARALVAALAAGLVASGPAAADEAPPSERLEELQREIEAGEAAESAAQARAPQPARRSRGAAPGVHRRRGQGPGAGAPPLDGRDRRRLPACRRAAPARPSGGAAHPAFGHPGRPAAHCPAAARDAADLAPAGRWRPPGRRCCSRPPCRSWSAARRRCARAVTRLAALTEATALGARCPGRHAPGVERRAGPAGRSGRTQDRVAARGSGRARRRRAPGRAPGGGGRDPAGAVAAARRRGRGAAPARGGGGAGRAAAGGGAAPRTPGPGRGVAGRAGARRGAGARGAAGRQCRPAPGRQPAGRAPWPSPAACGPSPACATACACRWPAAWRWASAKGPAATSTDAPAGSIWKPDRGRRWSRPTTDRWPSRGRFRRYGLLLIIEHDGRYHSLLSGLERIDAVVGQWVLAGEPVGGDGPAGRRPGRRHGRRQHGRRQRGGAGGRHASTTSCGATASRSTPLPWLAMDEEKARG